MKARLAFLAFSLSLFGMAFAAEPMVVAVLDATLPDGVDALWAGPIADKVVEAFLAAPAYRVVDRSVLGQLLKEQELAASGLLSDETAQLLGRLVGARAMVSTRVSRLGETWFVRSRMIDVETGLILAQASLERPGGPESLTGLGYEAGRSLTGSSITAAVPGREGETLVLRVVDADGAAPFLQEAMGRFRALHPLVSFELAPSWGAGGLEYHDFAAAMKEGRGPDIVFSNSPSIVDLWKDGALKPIEGLVPTEGVDHRALDALRPQGELVGFPWALGGLLVLMYDRALVDAPPESLEDVYKLDARLIKEEGVRALAWGAREFYGFLPFLAARRGGIVDAFGRGKVDRKILAAALADYRTSMRKLGCAALTRDGATEAFLQGKAAMLVGGDWLLSEMRRRLGKRLGVAPLPTLGRRALSPSVQARAAGLSASLDGPKLEAALEFLRFLAEPGTQEIVPVVASSLPVQRGPAIDRLLGLDPVLSGSRDALAAAVQFPPVAGAWYLFENLGPILDRFLGGSDAASKAVGSMEEEIRRILR